MCGVIRQSSIGTITVEETSIQRYLVMIDRFQQGNLILISPAPQHNAGRSGAESKTVGLCISKPLDPQRTEDTRGE